MYDNKIKAKFINVSVAVPRSTGKVKLDLPQGAEKSQKIEFKPAEKSIEWNIKAFKGGD